MLDRLRIQWVLLNAFAFVSALGPGDRIQRIQLIWRTCGLGWHLGFLIAMFFHYIGPIIWVQLKLLFGHPDLAELRHEFDVQLTVVLDFDDPCGLDKVTEFGHVSFA